MGLLTTSNVTCGVNLVKIARSVFIVSPLDDVWTFVAFCWIYQPPHQLSLQIDPGVPSYVPQFGQAQAVLQAHGMCAYS